MSSYECIVVEYVIRMLLHSQLYSSGSSAPLSLATVSESLSSYFRYRVCNRLIVSLLLAAEQIADCD